MNGCFKQCPTGKVTVGNTHKIVLIIYNHTKGFDQLEQIYDEKNEVTIKMVEEAMRQAPLRDGKVLIIDDCFLNEIDSEHLDSQGKREL